MQSFTKPLVVDSIGDIQKLLKNAHLLMVCAWLFLLHELRFKIFIILNAHATLYDQPLFVLS